MLQTMLATLILGGELLDFSLFSVDIAVSVKVNHLAVECDATAVMNQLIFYFLFLYNPSRLWQVLALFDAKLARFLIN